MATYTPVYDGFIPVYQDYYPPYGGTTDPPTDPDPGTSPDFSAADFSSTDFSTTAP